MIFNKIDFARKKKLQLENEAKAIKQEKEL